MSRKLWAICLAVWLVLWGLLQISNVRFEAQGLLLGAPSYCYWYSIASGQVTSSSPQETK